MSRLERCPACGCAHLESFYRAADVPTNSCLLLEDASAARDFPTGDVELGLCPSCAFITNVAFDPSLAEYSQRYEETQGFSETFIDFGRRLAKRWVEDYDLAGGHVLEIGCGKGEFLTWMVEAGAGSGTGIDPGVHPERLEGGAAERIDWIADFYDGRYRGLTRQADAVVCRHTLEHIHDVGGFLATVRDNIGDRPDTVVLFELPDALRVLREAAFWDVYYEHCGYFTRGSLTRLFAACGFEVLDASYAYEDQYLLVEALPGADGPGPAVPGPDRGEDAEVGALAAGFGARVGEEISSWRDRIARVARRGGSVALWGGGSKAVAFLAALGDPSLVAAAVDINPHKQGRFIAGTGHPVVAPERLTDLMPELVVAMNPVYVPEIDAALDALGVTTRLESL